MSLVLPHNLSYMEFRGIEGEGDWRTLDGSLFVCCRCMCGDENGVSLKFVACRSLCCVLLMGGY